MSDTSKESSEDLYFFMDLWITVATIIQYP